MSKRPWTVRNTEGDGTHTLGRYTTYAGALAKAKAWLGDVAEWQDGHRAISMYGGALKIEGPWEPSEQDRKDLDAWRMEVARMNNPDPEPPQMTAQEFDLWQADDSGLPSIGDVCAGRVSQDEFNFLENEWEQGRY